MELIGVTKNHEKPNLKMYRQIVEGEEMIMGYFDKKENSVFINDSNQTCKSTMFEELSHYISGASDMTRDFQTFILGMVARLSEEVV